MMDEIGEDGTTKALPFFLLEKRERMKKKSSGMGDIYRGGWSRPTAARVREKREGVVALFLGARTLLREKINVRGGWAAME